MFRNATVARCVRTARFATLAVTAALLATGSSIADDKAPAPKPIINWTEDSFESGKMKIQVRRFEPSGPGKRPAVVMLHGCDGWEQMAAYEFAAAGLVETGHVAILIRYYDRTKTPDHISSADRDGFARWLKGDAVNEKDNAARRHFDEWIAAVTDAVAYARRLPNVEPTRVGIAGFSLGGYVALSAAGKCEPPVRAVVEMFGGVPKEKRQTLRAMPPALLIHGELDDVVPVDEAYVAFGLLLAKKQVAEIEIYTGVGHVCIPPGQTKPNYKLWLARTRMADFFVRHMPATDTRTVRK